MTMIDEIKNLKFSVFKKEDKKLVTKNLYWNKIFKLEGKLKKTNDIYLKNYVDIEYLENIIKGKTVAFVGMSPNIKDKNLGEEIDSFDIVYRTNFYPLPTHLHKDYGSKCNILALQLKYHQRIIENKDIDLFITYHYCQYAHASQNKIINISNKKKYLLGRFMNEYINGDVIFPTAGMLAYFIAESLGCSRFKYFGITGYQNENKEIVNHGEYEHVIEEYKNSFIRRETILKTEMKKVKCHNFQKENDFRRLIIKENICEIDEYSKKYFI